MKVSFTIHFSMAPNRRMCVSLERNTPKGWQSLETLLLQCDGHNIWRGETEIHSENEAISLRYRYFISGSDGLRLNETGYPHSETLPKACTGIEFIDQWRGNDSLAPLLYKPFSEVFPQSCPTDQERHRRELVIKTNWPASDKDTRLLVCTDSNGWNLSESYPMTPSRDGRWTLRLDAGKFCGKISFKFVKITTSEEYIWENGNNRSIDTEGIREGEIRSYEFSAAAFDVPHPKFAGTAVPIFSLRSEDGSGAGDFTDLKKIAQWAALTGQRVIQILPVNDTTTSYTRADSYPYSGISVNALHPLYLNPYDAGEIPHGKLKESLDARARELNSLEEIDYEKTIRLKWEYIRLLYSHDAGKCEKSPQYKEFFEANRHWLLPYAAFCTLRDRFKTADFTKWEDYSHYTPEKVEEMFLPENASRKTMLMHIYVQYHLHLQLRQAIEYAHSVGVAIKGDIPIGITPHSVEAWTRAEYFNMDSQAGAPPDDFAPNGQNWGFPTYNWMAIAADGYRWWKERFGKMAEYFDIYRIDHVLGFFRIWEIPKEHISGLMGHFSPALPLSAQELLERGMRFSPQEHSEPYVTEDILVKMFVDTAQTVAERFFIPLAGGRYSFKEEFNTQRKIHQAFLMGKFSSKTRDALEALICNRLFIEDPRAKGMYHPRIGGNKSMAFELLGQEMKDAYKTISDDFFYNRHNDFWKGEGAMKLHEIISSTVMLPCAEDLGMIPACVPQVLKEQKVLSLEVQRMPKEPGKMFADTSCYPYLSVCTTGTHDTSTLRQWWEEDSEKTQVYYNDILGMKGKAPRTCTCKICNKIVSMHLHSPSMLAILPLQDWLSIDPQTRNPKVWAERINIPSDPNHYWRYRMHISLEELMNAKKLNDRIFGLCTDAGRV